MKFLSREVNIKVESTLSPFTNSLNLGDQLAMPIAHKQGNFQITNNLLKKIQDNNQIAFTYVEENGNTLNGSIANIAGIFNESKNILGMMPHPERAADPILSSQDGIKIFKSLFGAR